MSEQETQQIPHQRGGSLVTDRGNTRITQGTVAQVIDSVTDKADGLRVSGAGIGKGSSIEVGQQEVAIDLKVSADYNRSIIQVTDTLRHEVTERIESLLGLRVTDCNIAVDDIYFPHEERQQQSQQEEQNKEPEPRVR